MNAADRGISPFKAGLLVVTTVAVFCFFVFLKVNPFEHPFQLKGEFQNSSALRLNSPVREAGVEIGKVTKIDRAPDSSAALVTMTIQRNGLPLHSDTELKIRPRIFLEGNFFVDVSPGTPSARKLESGATIPVTQTAAPVQLDQVLGSLQFTTRRALQQLVRGYGGALDGKPTKSEDADQTPDTRGETAAKSLNDATRYAPRALRGVATVNQALLGTDVHDLSRMIAGTRRVTGALASREQSLKDLVTNFNTTMGAFAAQQTDLRESIHLLPGVLERANATFAHLNASFPPTRAFAREILPGVRETPATIAAGFPWIRQARKLLSPAELQGLANDLQPGTRDLAKLTNGTVKLLPQVDLASKCAYKVVLPAGDLVAPDPPLTTGVATYKEFFQSLASLSGEGQNFDGNGQYTRFQVGGGDQSVSTGALPGLGRLFGNVIFKPLGTRPARPARRPPKNRKFPCYRNKLPNLANAGTGGGP